MQIFTYTVITLGFALFFSGLIGWVGGASESPFLVGLFLFFVVISMLAEIGGIIALKIAQLEVNINPTSTCIYISVEMQLGLT